MGRLTTVQKQEIQAHLETFDFSGLEYKLSYNLSHHYKINHMLDGILRH